MMPFFWQVNIATSLLYVLFFYQTGADVGVFYKITSSVLAIIQLILLPSINMVFLIQFFCKTKFAFWEYASLAAFASVFFIPSIYLLEILALESFSLWLPYLNSLLVLSAVLVLRIFFVNRWNTIDIPKSELPSIRSPFWLVLVVQIAVIVSINTAFYPLPEIDPYYWLEQWQALVASDNFSGFSARPLYFSLISIFIRSSNIDAYFFFKYSFPFLSLLALIPAWLVARTFASKWQQTIIMLIPFAAPSTILFQQMPIPQTLVIISSLFILYWLLYSAKNKRGIFFYFAILAALIGQLYHEMNSIVLLVLLLVTVITDGNKAVVFLKKERLVLVMVLLLAIPYRSILLKPISFIQGWHTYMLLHFPDRSPNWLFPTRYTTIDLISTGWPGWEGVVKYYLYYAGLIPIILLALALPLMFSGLYRKNLKLWIVRREWVALAALFILFFAISDIVPRTHNVAFLPERAWLFTGMFSAFLLPPLFQSLRYRKNVIIYCTLILLFFISIGGSLYVNHGRKFVITEHELAAADWIKNNLTDERIVITNGSKRAVKHHSSSEAVRADNSFFCEENNDKLRQIALLVSSTTRYKHRQEKLNKDYYEEVKTYLSNNTYPDPTSINSVTDGYLEKTANFSKSSEEEIIDIVYIYYHREDRRNPYLKRPNATNLIECEGFYFDRHQEQFTQIYNDNNNSIIWKINKATSS